MAAIAAIMGGTTGFISALVALILFNASWLLALGLWVLGGMVVALVLIGMAMMPRRETAQPMSAKHA